MSDPQAAPGRILVVDDDPVVRTLASQALAAVGFLLTEAEDGRAALDAIDRERPDLVLLDVQLPLLDGFETCAALRARPETCEIPVLMATGLADSGTIERAFEVGATDFIEKPIDWQILQHRVRFLLRASRAFADLSRTLSELRSSEERLANAQRIARIGNWEWEPGCDDMLWSEEIYRVLGIEVAPGASTYQAFLGAVHPDDREAVEKALLQAAAEARPVELDHRISRASGAQRVVRQHGEVSLGADGRVALVSGTTQDITDRKRAEEQIRYLTSYDSLTALPNRRMLSTALARALDHAITRRSPLALLYLNLDRFKRINDTLGHVVGDDLLRAVAHRLVTCVRATDRVGRLEAEAALPVWRLGGDEFAIVLSVLRDSEDAEQVARRILDVLRAPFALDGQQIVMTASIGIAVHPSDGPDAETLLRNANSALHHAKAAGRDVYQFFSRSMNERAARNLRLEGALRAALERGELELHFQPQCDARSGGIVGTEALVRWPAGELGPVEPSEFIPLAEETGLIVQLGNWVIERACHQAREWERVGLAPVRVAVNVSSHQLRRPDLLETVQRALAASGLDPARLELELTESALLSDEAIVLEHLEGLKELGVRIALDDFGTGYSSLSHLVRFPIDTLKIDRSFVSGGGEAQADAIVAAVVAMARRLGLSVVAEGVETATQEAYMRAEGCDWLQGLRLGSAMPPDAFAALLRDRT